jgi:limonene-1,2-epoxide hydrolase
VQVQAEAVQHQGPHLQEVRHLYTKDLHLLQNQALPRIHTTAVLIVLEAARTADTQETLTTEAVVHQAPATPAAVLHLQEDSQEVDQVSQEVHLLEVATAEDHQEVIDDKTIRHEKDSIDYSSDSHDRTHQLRPECI